MDRLLPAALVAASLVCCRPAASPTVDAASILESKVLLVVPGGDARPDAGLGTADFDPNGTASAFVLEDGRILTAGHVAATLDAITVRDEQGALTRATLERVDERLDLALFRPARPLPSRLRLRLADATPPTGTEVFTFGTSALGVRALAQGVIAGHARGAFAEQIGPMTFTNIQAWHGTSGAPMLTMDGGPRVVGLNVNYVNINISDDPQAVGLLGAVPVEDLRAFLDGRVAPAVARYVDYARGRRSIRPSVAFRGPRVVETKVDGKETERVVLDFLSALDTTVDVDLQKGGKTLVSDHLDVHASHLMSMLTYLPPDDVAGGVLEVRAAGAEPRTYRFADPGAGHLLATAPDVAFSVNATPSAHGWFDIALDATAPIAGNVVMLTAYVLDGSNVIGRTHECFEPHTDPASPFGCSAHGVAWAPRKGSYDVVLVAGATPIAYRRLDLR